MADCRSLLAKAHMTTDLCDKAVEVDVDLKRQSQDRLTDMTGSDIFSRGFPAYSFRADTGVPAFPDSKPLVVFDGVCIFCSGFAKFILRHDRRNHLNLCTAQSKLGQALYLHYGLDLENYETNIVISGGRPHFKSDAFFEVMKLLGGGWPLLALLQIFPRRPRNWLYDRIARNRYKLFGKSESCMVPSPEQRTKIIDPA